MKKLKWLLILLILMIGIGVAVYHMQKNRAEKKAYEVLSTLVPRNKQIKLKITTPGNGLRLFPESYDFAVTTKEDYNHWRSVVVKRKHFLSPGTGDNQMKELINDPNNCEIIYKTTQTVKRGKPDDDIMMIYGDDGFINSHYPSNSPYTNQRHFKTWNQALKHMYDNFSCLPSNEELVSKWDFPSKTVKELAEYRKSLNK
ncbi:hypothetical protein [Xylocopilactobacillus apicola]|uniref:Uncharacterized protein n=1 Tax=Xylocopilactobacillus apicola TaxID=2932184 RepID=A0AAU9DDX8_9LACO|nr:hypothetical protein [Xylocopilactobacillus apicola]BDR58035.1 hypothetical protein XA3_04760 [Xylocopilactobacillus apicola]